MLNRTITAGKGKVFRRIADQTIWGKEIHLGYTYYIGGVLLDEPLEELPEHFEEIDEPITDETPILDEETIIEEVVDIEQDNEIVKEIKKVTIADYRALEEKVNQLMNIINGGVK